jgi:DNA polymerase-1
MTNKKRLIVIDSHSLIHRAYHALPPLATKKGEEVGAIYGFLLVFLKVLKELKPDFIVATFDLSSPTFRHKKFEFYKAKRPKLPDSLCQQIPKVKEVLKVFGVPVFEKEGFEADDLIGAISKIAPKKQIFPEIETIILSGDFDVLQLVNSQTKVYALRRGVKDTVLYNEDLVKEKYQGLESSQLVDFKALRGDPSDNVPGVRGIGEKTALQLIKEFGSLKNLYQEIEKNTEKSRQIKTRIKESLVKNKEEALASKELVEIKSSIPLDFNLEECRFEGYDKEAVIEILKKFEFFSLIKRLPASNNLKGDENLIE